MEHAVEAEGNKGAHVQQAEVGQIIKEGLKMKLTEQDVLALTNNEKRKAVLAAWREWPIWADVPEIGLTVYRLDLPVGPSRPAGTPGMTFSHAAETATQTARAST